MDAIDIEYDIDLNAFAALIRKRLLRSTLFIMNILACVAPIFLYWGNWGKGILFTTILATAFSLRWWQAPRRWLASSPHMTERKKLHITSNKISTETATVKSEVPWTYFISWNETPEHFTLDLTASGFCSIIPKTSMTSEQQTQFRDWAAGNLPKAPKRLKKG